MISPHSPSGQAPGGAHAPGEAGKRDGERGNGGASRMIHGESSVIRTMSGCLRGW
jgi:hypothetical protein